MSKNQPSSTTSGSEPPRDVGTHGLEPALRVGEAGAEAGVDQARCSRARGPRASAGAGCARRDRAASRSRPHCVPRGAARPAAGGSSGSSRGRRPCRRRRRRGSRARPCAARARGPCAGRGAPTTSPCSTASCRATAGVASVLALSAITTPNGKGNSRGGTSSSSSVFGASVALLVVDGDDDFDCLQVRVHGAPPSGGRLSASCAVPENFRRSTKTVRWLLGTGGTMRSMHLSQKRQARHRRRSSSSRSRPAAPPTPRRSSTPPRRPRKRPQGFGQRPAGYGFPGGQGRVAAASRRRPGPRRRAPGGGHLPRHQHDAALPGSELGQDARAGRERDERQVCERADRRDGRRAETAARPGRPGRPN